MEISAIGFFLLHLVECFVTHFFTLFSQTPELGLRLHGLEAGLSLNFNFYFVFMALWFFFSSHGSGTFGLAEF